MKRTNVGAYVLLFAGIFGVASCASKVPPSMATMQPMFGPGGSASVPPRSTAALRAPSALPGQAAPVAPSYPVYPAQSNPSVSPSSLPVGVWQLVGRSKARALPGGARYMEARVQGPGGTVDLNYVVFDSRLHTLRVMDQAASTAGGTIIAAAMHYHGAIAGVNGGFFSKDFEPMGLVISGGRTLSEFSSKSSLITGMVAVTGGEPYLLWNAEHQGGAGYSDALQAGPRLVSSSQPVSGLSAARSTSRTFIATDGGRLWVLGVARSCSLADLAQILTSPAVLEMNVMRALNLDGGHSSALWAGPTSGAEVSQPGWSTVRNYLGVVPKR